MRRVLAIGIGAGDLEHMTVGAIRALNEADVLFEIERGVDDLTALCGDLFTVLESPSGPPGPLPRPMPP